MKYCKKFAMPNTRPGISFDLESVCSACQLFECAIPVSGGKESHYQVYLMKEFLKMNPILFTIEEKFPMTEVVRYNVKNISKKFGCQLNSLKSDRKVGYIYE